MERSFSGILGIRVSAGTECNNAREHQMLQQTGVKYNGRSILTSIEAARYKLQGSQQPLLCSWVLLVLVCQYPQLVTR